LTTAVTETVMAPAENRESLKWKAQHANTWGNSKRNFTKRYFDKGKRVGKMVAILQMEKSILKLALKRGREGRKKFRGKERSSLSERMVGLYREGRGV